MAESKYPIKTYEIAWANGNVERIECESFDYTSLRYSSEKSKSAPGPSGYGHIVFWRSYVPVLGIREGDVISVRLIPSTVLQEDEAAEAGSDEQGQEKED